MEQGSRRTLYSVKDDSNIRQLAAEAKRRYDAMSLEERRDHDRAQRRSWIKGEIMLDDSSLTDADAEALLQELGI